MDTTDSARRGQRLKRMVRSEVESREDVVNYEIAQTDDPGIHLIIETDSDVSHYHVALERHPEGTVKTNWQYLGTEGDD
ncbi:hypothetical protein [Natronomonas sp. LN261]|uniref:hypothetical protein n=1 Tax=Natronomonas sp. LN261 TaxID=2750669 RepID=UPI0015EEA5AC|nr:hypothetical protein [Natronomonas sp. LN261]